MGVEGDELREQQLNVFDLSIPVNEYVYRNTMRGREALHEDRLEAAELFFQAALEHARQRLKACPRDLMALRDGAICWFQLGYLLQRIGEVEGAKDACFEAEERYSQVVEFAGRYGEYGREMAKFHWWSATLPLLDENYVDARALLESSVEILWVRSRAEPTCWERSREFAEATIRLGIAIKAQCDLELNKDQRG